jgi:predicted amidophosphoribosyltransferase
VPCYRCHRRQADPARGPSAWKRGVSHGEQVLVCPECQRDHDWIADLDRCAACGSTRLSRSLGSTRCGECGATGAAAAGADDARSAAPSQPTPGELAADVSAALRRVFGDPTS